MENHSQHNTGAQSAEELNDSGIPYAVGAAFARYVYTGIWRKTKDLDLFLKPQDLKTALDAFSFRVDIEDWGYEDQPNLKPLVNDQEEAL